MLVHLSRVGLIMRVVLEAEVELPPTALEEVGLRAILVVSVESRISFVL